MTKYGSPDLVIKVDNAGGTLVDITEYVDSINGIEIEAKLQEHLPFGETWVGQLFTGVKQGAAVTLEGFYDDTATTGPDAILNALGSTRTLEVTYGSTKKTTIETILTKYNRNPSAGEKTRYVAELTPTGEIQEN